MNRQVRRGEVAATSTRGSPITGPFILLRHLGRVRFPDGPALAAKRAEPGFIGRALAIHDSSSWFLLSRFFFFRRFRCRAGVDAFRFRFLFRFCRVAGFLFLRACRGRLLGRVLRGGLLLVMGRGRFVVSSFRFGLSAAGDHKAGQSDAERCEEFFHML